MTDAWGRLKSGTDIRGIAVGRPGETETLPCAVGLSVGAAYVRLLADKTGKPPEMLTIAVGRDSRVSGEALMQAIVQGMGVYPVTVLDCGLCTTPAMFMTTVMAGCDGAVMVTASHLPWDRNGYKFFTAQGGLEGSDIDMILKDAENTPPLQGTLGNVRKIDFLGQYTAFLAEKAHASLSGEKPLDGLHVVVDAGNGSGGFYAELLSSLGACTRGSQFLTPDGHFPNHIPNPEASEAMESLSDAVTAFGADLGVLFDADCDRAALVDRDGRAIHRNRLIALTASVLLRETPGITVVTDSVTSAGLDDFLSIRGGTLHRFKRGYRNVIGEAQRLCASGVDCPLAMETSGHAALRENYFLDDGMYLATRLIIEAARLKRQGKALCELIGTLAEPLEATEVRLPIHTQDFRPAGEDAMRRIEALAAGIPGWTVDADNREGIRMQCGGKGCWFLLRMSVHDPLLVLNAESDRPGGVGEMLLALEKALSSVPAIDLTALRANPGK